MDDRKKIEAIAIAAILAIAIFAGVMLVMAQTATVTDTAPTTAAPGETYVAYNITFVANSTDWLPTNLSWFNISGMNQSISDIGNFSNITNVSVILNTTGYNIVNYSTALGTSSMPPTSFPIHLNLSNATYTSGIPITNTSTVNLTINLTINTTGLMDGTNISINATLTYWGNESNYWTHTNYTNDTAPEAIEVLNAAAGPSNLTAWEGDKTVLCANVTITPGNNSVDNYLKVITFNATSGSTLDSTYIESFGLWNDSNANKTFEPASDKMIANVTPPTSLNVTFNLSALLLDNRTIPTGATNGTFFLTMNITATAHTGNYTARIFEQNITINQTAGEGNTGNSSITTGFTHLWIDPADVTVSDGTLTDISSDETYIAYNITYYENVSNAGGSNLTWFNVSEMNQSVTEIAGISNITNVSVWNSTHWFCINYSNATNLNPSSPYFTVNLTNISNGQLNTVPDNSTYDLTIMITTNTTETVHWGKYISINATLHDNESSNLTANDPEPEFIKLTITVAPSSKTLTVGGTHVFTATAANRSGSVDGLVSGLVLTWESSSPGFGTVSSPSTTTSGTASTTFTAKAAGTTTITATNRSANGTASVTVQSVSVSRPRGGGGGTTTSATATGETSVSTEATGEVTTSVTAASTDAKASVTISAETIAKDAAGSPLTSVTVTQPSALPAGAPSGANYVGYAYTFGPAGATFSKPVTISITFDSANLNSESF